tara:strand:+ start:280 stop:1089 length:810 start_codon:yes stop_codon:yes gene_type:complete
MPAGNSQRLEAVLRAGQHRLATTGETTKLKGAAAADALKKKPAAPQVRKGSGAKKVVKQDNDDMGATDNSSEWLKDLVDSYKNESTQRSKTLETVRKAAQECAETRIAAVNEALKEQEASATKIVEALKDKLKQVSAELEKLRSSSADNTTQKDACEDARSSLDRELKALKESCNKERDDAKASAELKLKDTIAEWTTKLKECEAKNAASGVESSKKLEECLDKLKASQDALKAEQAVNAKHIEEAAAKNKKFQNAIDEACKALNAALK